MGYIFAYDPIKQYLVYMEQKSSETTDKIIGIITGDIIKSTQIEGNKWVGQMESVLQKEGKEGQDWTIFGGDTFQLKTANPAKAITKAIYIFSEMYGKHEIRLRQSIGIGGVEYDSGRLATSNGLAFRFSGRGIEKIGKRKLIVKSGSKDFDLMAMTMLSLAEKIIDDWTPRMAYIFFMKMSQPEKTQKELAKMLDVRQSVISESLKRSGHKEIDGMLNYMENQLPYK